jgi:autotransporter strand-loop-strand O-heptosyltransferase
MPYSYSFYKEEVKLYLDSFLNKNIKILDVGPGVGTYSNLLKPLGYKLDCLEIFEPYVEKYDLHSKYENVYVGDITQFDFSNYDFIIIGDVLEHISVEDSKIILEKIENNNQNCLVAVPFLCEQGTMEDNIHETHLQPDLTNELVLERYPQLELLSKNNFYGYYVTKSFLKLQDKGFVLYCNEKYLPIAEQNIKTIRKYSELPIYVYTINKQHNFNIPNVHSIEWKVDLDVFEDQMYSQESSNFYINRDDKRFYKLLIERPKIVKHCLDNFCKQVAYIDTDSVCMPWIDNFFNHFNSLSVVPYFTEGIYEFFMLNGRGGTENLNDLSTTLEHPSCELFNVDQNVRRYYRQTGYFIAGQNCKSFLDEWYWMCNHPKILNNPTWYAPYQEETIANVLLWKQNRHEGLHLVYVNGNKDTANKLFNNIKFTGTPQHIQQWLKVPGKLEHIYFIHGEKNIDEMEKISTIIDNQVSSTKKLKVLFLAPHLSTGGMPGFLLKRIQNLLEYTKDVEIYVVEFANLSDDYVVQKNQIKNLVTNFYTLGENKLELIDILKNNNIDVIHIDEMVESLGANKEFLNALYSNDRTWRIIETCHNVFFNPLTDKIFNPEAYAFVTPWHQQKTFSSMPSYNEVIEFPVSNCKVNNETKKYYQQLLGFNPDKIHVVNVGLWTPGKNQGEGLKIAKQLEQTNPEIQFHFVGNQAPNFKEYWEPLMKDVSSNVTIWGERADADSFMKACDVFMFNSTWECNPLVLREAISYGKKILSRNLPQYLDMFAPYITPINDDMKETSDKLLLLIDKDVDYKVNEGQEQEFALKHESLYNKIKALPINTQSRKALDVNIVQHFVDGPFLEIKGKSNSTFDVKFYDEKGVCHYENTIKANHWVKLNRKYYTKWNTKIWQDEELVYDNYLDFKSKKILISIDSKSLGDNIAWMPYIEEFRKKHNCKLVASTFWNKFFQPQYPEIEFVEPGSTVHNLYGLYKIGWFYDKDNEPKIPNVVALQKTATNILGLEFKEIKPNIDFTPLERSYEEKYITIATNSTAGCKFWTKEGWQELINYLHNKGYKIINVSKEDNPFDNVTKIQDTSIENTMNVIHHSELFIGLSSGLSWLAWALGKHVVMISNFTEPNHEFISNCTRIYNHSVCNSCWNDPDFVFDKGDWDWCPKHKGTDRQFECHTSIKSEQVINQIKFLI